MTRNLKHILAAFGCLLAGVQTLMAIPATPCPVSVTQPDGTELTLIIRGDEHGAVMMTTDGYPVVQNPQTGIYEFASVEKHSLSSLGIAAMNPGYRSIEITQKLNTIDRPDISTILEARRATSTLRKSSPRKVKISNYPTLGRQKALVILVEFEDEKFSSMSDPYQYYNGLLNEEGFVWPQNGANGSARDFYLASSDGKFDPDFTVVGPVTLNKPLNYYGGDTFDALDPNAVDMILEAATAADDTVDFTEFDADGDGYVDNIYFFYAGRGQADSGISYTIWPHSGLVEDNWGRELTLDGMRINRYACSNEIRGGASGTPKPVGIGTFVHEFGHVLGIADHYDTMYASGRLGVNQWDTMAGASYFNNQNTPPLFNAFERAELGWLEYTDIEPDTTGILSLPTLDIESKAYRIIVDGTDGREYFVIENRRKQGWDEYLPGEGMLVWHVDMDEEKWWSNTINNDPVHQYFDLVEADGKETDNTYASDPFPGKSNITSFSFTNWAGEEEFALDHITQNEGVAKLLLGNTSFMPEKPAISIDRLGGRTLHFSWAPVADAQHYTVRLEEVDGEVVDGFDNVIVTAPEPTVVETLTPNTTYRLALTTHIGSYKSETVTETFTTSDICFFEMTPQTDEVTVNGGDTFSLTWQPLPEADNYIVTLEEMSYDEETESVCDFSEIAAPWHSSTEKYNRALFGEKSPSLQLDSDEDYFEFVTEEGKISQLSFWVRSQSASNSFRVEELDAETFEWNVVATEKPGSSAANYTYEISDAPAVRVVFEKTSGYLLLDDVKCVWHPLEWKGLPEYTDYSTAGECIFTPTGLKTDTSYRVALTGVSGNELSKTAFCRVKTSETVGIDLNTADTSRKVKVVYNIYGNKVDDGYQGFVIVVFEDGTSKKIIRP